MLSTIVVLLSAARVVLAQGGAYAQCGGNNFSGPTTCISGYTCVFQSEWYSQCLPGTASSSTSASSPAATLSTRTTSVSSPATTLSTRTTSLSSTTLISTSIPTSTAYPGTTLQTGYYWIRAVEAPNYHYYLQTSPPYVPGTAILESYTTAGQFQVVNGQLVELVSGGLLYANVEQQANSTVVKLAVTFSKTQNTYGTFSWSGDALQWSVPTINRPNLSAWLVCGSQQLFINLGAYLYMTPAGCVDETIHYYNDVHAVA